MTIENALWFMVIYTVSVLIGIVTVRNVVRRIALLPGAQRLLFIFICIPVLNTIYAIVVTVAWLIGFTKKM